MTIHKIALKKNQAVDMFWKKRNSRLVEITFEVIDHSGGNKPVYIVGNHPNLGGWSPDKVQLEKVKDGLWRKKIVFQRNLPLEYKFTRGGWESEALDKHGKTFHNHSARSSSRSVWRTDVYGWKDNLSAEKLKTQYETVVEDPSDRITGTVKFHRDMEVPGLQSRDIVVWLPPDYEKQPQKSYPVLYMHDGQNIFDPYTAYTGVDWQADETATRLIKKRRIKPIIIVGIYNCDDRLEEYSLSPKGRKYMTFIVETLMPFIEKNYRTLGGPENNATMGSSMGGLISFLLAWQYPHKIGLAACLSPSFIFNKNHAIKQLRRAKNFPLNSKIYMDCGTIGGERLLMKGCNRVLRILARQGLAPGERLHFFVAKDGRHSEVNWAARLWRPMTFLFKK